MEEIIPAGIYPKCCFVIENFLSGVKNKSLSTHTQPRE